METTAFCTCGLKYKPKSGKMYNKQSVGLVVGFGGRNGERMKVIHTADLHLGAEPEKGAVWAENRGKELWETLERLIMYTEKSKAELLLIAGDLFHRQPLLRELKEVNYLFSSLTQTKVIIIAGNHDYIKQDSYYRSFEWCRQVSFLKSTGIECRDFPELNLSVYGGSYYSKEETEPVYNRIVVTDTKRVNILLGHGGDEKHRPYDLMRLQESSFDYIALGHIHKGGELVKNRIVQAGCLEPADRTDTGVKGFYEGEITKEGVRMEFVPFAKRSYLPIEIMVTSQDTVLSVTRRIQEAIEKSGRQNMYCVTLMGQRDQVIQFTKENFEELGNIVSFDDRTRPDYDIEELYQANQNNVLGWYMKEFMNKQELNETERQALDYGIRALTYGE